MTVNDGGTHNGVPFTNDTNGTNDMNGHHDNPNPSPIPIAIVGMACRFAGGATSPDKLWDLCASGRDAWSRIPKSRFDVNSLYDANREKPGRNHATGGYFLEEDVALFDAAFFNFTGDEASAMDPQLRLLLEVVYEATEDAGLPIEKLAGPGPSTSVFTGCYTKDYHDLQTRDVETTPTSAFTGNYTAMFSNRVSRFYDFQGASISLDTGCSASLAALHQGCQTIRSGESKVSIIGASNTILNPDTYIAMSSLGMVGAEGRCYAWDSRAQGYGRGEGVAVLVLKSFDDALRDGDQVHGVIRNSGLNHDGKTTTIPSPSLEAQVRLIRDCYRRAGLNLSDTGYVEAHMAGTQAGDAIEAESLAHTFGMSRPVNDPVWIGSVKTNVGHTEGVSGLAGIIKTAMGMKHRSIASNLNYKVGNSRIPLQDWNLQVPTALVPWPHDKVLRASINNFGYGGTNAHVILERAPEQRQVVVKEPDTSTAQDEDATRSRLYILSAQDAATTKTMAGNLAAYLRQHIAADTCPTARDLASTLVERRSRLSWVAVVAARSLAELANRLENPAVQVAYVPPGKKVPRLGFVFNGQGAQWHAMGRGLLSEYPVFAAAVKEADVVLRGHGADWSLTEELMRDAKSTRVSEIHLGQPITVALQICLVVLLHSWGIYPSAVTSHSSGEIAATYAAGVLSFEQALGVVYWCGELARTMLDQKSSGVVGGMAAAGLGPEDAHKYIANTSSGGRVVVACVNGPESVTLAGDLQDLEEVVARLKADGRFARNLEVPLAYHSHQMQPMASAYTEKLRGLVPSEPTWSGRVLYTSPVTGSIISSPDVLIPEHYVRNLMSPVLFSQAFENMCFGSDGASGNQVDAIVEIGPHSTMAGPIRQILKGRKVPYVSCLKRPVDAVETMQDLAGELVRLGYPVSLGAVNHLANNGPGPETTHFVADLPTYPWNHTTSYWVESRINKDIRHKKFPPHELLGLPVSGATTPAWRNFLRLSDLPWVGDHRVDGMIVLPNAAYASMAIEAVRLITDLSEKDIRGYHLRDVEFLGALTIPGPSASSSGGGVETHLQLQNCHEDDLTDWYRFNVRSLGADDVWVENSRGLVSAIVNSDVNKAIIPEAETFLEDNGRKKGTKMSQIGGAALRAQVAEMGLEYGPTFQGLTDGRASTANKRAVSHLCLNALGSSETESEPNANEKFQTSYVIHPTTLDCIFQATYTNLPTGTGKTSIVLPRSIQEMFVPQLLNRQVGDGLTVFSELHKAKRKGFVSNVSAVNASDEGENGTALLEINRLFCQAIPRVIKSSPELRLWSSRWEPDVLDDIPVPVKDSMRITLGDEEVDWERKLVRASYYLISDAVTSLEVQNPEDLTPHQHALFAWMKTVVAQGKSGKLATGNKLWARATKGVKQILFDELQANGGTHGRLLVHIGQQLAAIVRGKSTPADVLKKEEEAGDVRTQYYQDLPRLRNRSSTHLAKLIQLFTITNPGAKLLEIGAGDGRLTQAVLQACGNGGDGGSLIDQYVFTDVSSGLFDAAKKRLAAWANVLEFRELDVREGLTLNNSPAHKVDLIVASMVQHGSKSLQQTLGHVRNLLKPGGHVLLIEPTQDRLDTQLVLGTLPGWEEEGSDPARKITVQSWDELLRANGFTGVDFSVGDCEQPEYKGLSVILTSAASPQEDVKEPSSATKSVSVVVHPSLSSSCSQQPWIAQLTEAIQIRTGIRAAVESFDQVQPHENKICVLATDVANGELLLDALDDTKFDRLRQILLGSRGILWLTSGGSGDDLTPPASAQVQGLSRALRQENASNTYILLDLPLNWAEEPEVSVGHIARVLQRVLHAQEADLADIDWEYALKDSVLHVPRVYPTPGTNKNNLPEPEAELMLPFQQPDRPLVWDNSALGFVDDQNDTGDEVSDGVVEIETKAFSLNHHGNHGNEDIPAAYEVAGIVTRLGSNTEASGLQVGDTVCGIAMGPFASTARAAWSSVVRIPDGVNWEEAACIPLAYAAAYHALVHVGRLQKGDKVMFVHTIGNQEGQAAIMLAIQIGAEVWVATPNGTQAEAHLLADQYQIPLNRVLTGQSTKGVGETILAQTNGSGVDVVVNTSSNSASLLQVAAEIIAHFGCFIELAGATSNGLHTRQLAARCATYARIDGLQLAEYNGRLMREGLEASFRILSCESSPRPPSSPMERFPISQLDKALQQGQRQEGKVVVVPQADDLVTVLPPSRSLSLAHKKATYLVFGDFDGIGRAIASLMVFKGARNVLVVSRNAEADPDKVSLAQDAAEKGCNLQFVNCDVSCEESVVRLIHQVTASLPPIRGVVHVAAVVEDTVFERMTFAQWQSAVQPKIAGTRNLHRHLPNDLSFFLHLSSVTSVTGHPSQANYAAASTFEDVLVCYRAAQGLAGISLNLPAITGGGIAAGDDAHRRMEALGTESMSIDALLGLIETAIERDMDWQWRRSIKRQTRTPRHAQVIAGLRPWSLLSPEATIRRDRRFGTLRLAGSASGAAIEVPAGNTTLDPTALLVQTISSSKGDPPQEKKKDKVAEALAGRLAAIFNMPVESVDLGLTLAAYGVDSSVAVELRNWLASVAKAKLSVFDILQSPSVRELAGLVVERSALSK